MVLWVGGAVAIAAAGSAAFSISTAERSIDHPPAAVAVAAASPDDRMHLTPAQLRQAIATGELDRPVVSLLKVDRPLRHGEFLWNDRAVPDGPVWVRVDLGTQLVSVFRAGHEIGTAVILYGAREKETPAGAFPVQWKRKDHRSSSYDAPMPYTLRLTDDGVAIHGSDVREGRATHGCIGVPIDFARRLFEQVSKGDQVVIIPAGAKFGEPRRLS